MNENKLTPFLAEVSEQPQALNDLITFYGHEGKERLKTWAGLARAAGRVVFSGMGTSEFAPEMVIGQMAGDGVDASFIDAGELLHYPRPVRGLPVLISQSGESVEIRELAVRSEDKKNMVAITNNTESTLARNAGLVLPLLSGQETAISTKTYTNTLAILFLMAQSLRDQFPLDRLKRVADTLPQVDDENIELGATLLADARALHFIGRGPAMAAVKQGGLTFMEGTRISATAFTGGTFRHGPFELVDDTHRCVFFMPGGKTFDLLKKMVLEVAGKGSHVVAITDQPLELSGPNCRVLNVAGHGEDLFCLSAATTQELLLEAVARARGITAGIFRYGQKITSRE